MGKLPQISGILILNKAGISKEKLIFLITLFLQ